MPDGPNSFESVFASPVVAARTEFERISPSIGSFTAIDVMLMIRACSDCLRYGSASRVIHTTLIRFVSIALRHAVVVVLLERARTAARRRC